MLFQYYKWNKGLGFYEIFVNHIGLLTCLKYITWGDKNSLNSTFRVYFVEDTSLT